MRRFWFAGGTKNGLVGDKGCCKASRRNLGCLVYRVSGSTRWVATARGGAGKLVCGRREQTSAAARSSWPAVAGPGPFRDCDD